MVSVDSGGGQDIVMHLLAECAVDCVMLGARNTLTIMGPKYMQVGHLGASG